MPLLLRRVWQCGGFEYGCRNTAVVVMRIGFKPLLVLDACLHYLSYHR